ncbi:hypothetical protein HH110_08970 [Stenotrophomonas sp. SAM-B]|nr:hypothetical protein [Stenotrophomonas sp. SAM-B]
MAVASGNWVVLNLGPRYLGGGEVISLNLGTDWNDTPVEPVVRGLRTDAGLRWGRTRATRGSVRVGWGASALLSAHAAPGWGSAAAVERQAVLGWGLTPLLKSSSTLHWQVAAGVRPAGMLLPWTSLPTAQTQLGIHWYSSLPGLLAASRFSWSSGRASHLSVDIAWSASPDARHASWAAPWRALRQGRRAATLPWGAAKPLPWIVRPPKPGPDPDPEPVFPPGNLVALSLGCALISTPGLAPLNLGATACYLVRPQQRTYVVINSISVVRIPDRTPIEVEGVSILSSVDAWGISFDVDLADSAQLALLKPTAAGPRQVEVTLNGYVWTAIIETYRKQREWNRVGVSLTGRSRTALLAAPYAPARVKATTEDRSVAQLVGEELADTGFTADYGTVDWVVPAGAWFYDGTPAMDAIARLAGASGAVVQSDPATQQLHVRARYPASPWDWRSTQPDHVLQEDIITSESLQVRSAPLYDAVIVTGELAGKGVTCKVRRQGEAGQLFAPQASDPLINTSAAGAERGRNILSDRGEQAAIELVIPLFGAPLVPGQIGRVQPLDLVEVVGDAGTWHGLCTAVRTEARADSKALVIEQTITLERHYTDAN